MGTEGPSGVADWANSAGVVEPSPQADNTKAAATITNVAADQILLMVNILVARWLKFETDF